MSTDGTVVYLERDRGFAIEVRDCGDTVLLTLTAPKTKGNDGGYVLQRVLGACNRASEAFARAIDAAPAEEA